MKTTVCLFLQANVQISIFPSHSTPWKPPLKSLSLLTFLFFAPLGKPDLQLAPLHSQTLTVSVLSDDQA